MSEIYMGFMNAQCVIWEANQYWQRFDEKHFFVSFDNHFKLKLMVIQQRLIKMIHVNLMSSDRELHEQISHTIKFV